MKQWKHILLLTALVSPLTLLHAEEITLKITGKYLNLPVSQQTERGGMQFILRGDVERSFVIRLAEIPEYWVFCDMSGFTGETLVIRYDGDAGGLRQIYQSDTIHEDVPIYCETNRPQFHFTARRGWINDPNGLVYYEGEYHLFYQHNPYEREWGNMHWGHAVSRDLVHWEELPVALYPDTLGTVFSGSAVIDTGNTSGFGRNAMVAVYTADGPAGQVQCVAYSLDRGRTWTKYGGNPVINSGKTWQTRDTRDPRVFRHKASGRWVMALNERDGHSIYTSSDLRNWTYRSHISGFWECPDLFDLPVDGNPADTRWVMYGASGTYLIGDFDGETFTPLQGKRRYTAGAMYAAQTFNHTPDGRRIQIGWGRIQQPGMPFNMMMLLPTELTLRTTPDGLQLFSCPVKEVDSLQEKGQRKQSLTLDEANEWLKTCSGTECLRIKTTLRLSHATSAGLKLSGQDIIDYDMNFNRINGYFYAPPAVEKMELTADILIDRTSIEVFVDEGAFSYAMERTARDQSGFHFWGSHPVEVINLEIYPVKSIWKSNNMAR
jgi:fructan beta-fructosidase